MSRECFGSTCRMVAIMKSLSLVKFGGGKDDCKPHLVDMGIRGRPCRDKDLVS